MTTARREALSRMILGAALISTTSIFVRWAHVEPTTSATPSGSPARSPVR